jgi:hypothetical protein
MNGELEILAFNAGYLCPPFCNNLSNKNSLKEIETEKIGISIVEINEKITII